MAKAEVKYKKQVNKALNELVIPPLQDIVNKFVQLATLSGQKAWWWDRVILSGVAAVTRSDFKHFTDDRYTNNIQWGGSDNPGWTIWAGPKIDATLDPGQLMREAHQFKDHNIVALTLSDSHNWSLDETSFTNWHS